MCVFVHRPDLYVIRLTCRYLLAVTFDVQTGRVEEGSEIEITVHLISNSRAMGCFVVLQSDSGSPDEFRVLLRSGSDLTLTDMISVPPSTYTLYVYDLEEDGHINTEPAVLPDDRIHVTKNSKLNEQCMHQCIYCIIIS